MGKQKKKSFECEMCHKKFSKKSTLLKHKQGHMGEKPYKCEFCGTGFLHKSTRQRHLLQKICDKSSNPVVPEVPVTPVEGKPKPYKCKCGLGFLYKSKYNRHKMEKSCAFHVSLQGKKDKSATEKTSKAFMVEKGKKPYYYCLKCGKSFLHKSRFNRHTILKTCSSIVSNKRHQAIPVAVEKSNTQIEAKKEKPYKCPVCGNGYSHYTNYCRHKRLSKCKFHILSQSSPSNSQVLNIKVQRKSAGTINEVEKNNLFIDNTMCIVCRKEFPSKSELDTHMNEHLFKKTLKCLVCAETFSSISKRRRHLKNHHSQIEKCACKLCGKGIKSFLGLLIHSLKHKDTRVLKCPLCGKILSRAVHLREHMNIHVKENHAAKASGSNIEHMSHINSDGKINEKGKSFNCSICKKRFMKKEKFKSHMKTHVTVEPSLDDGNGNMEMEDNIDDEITVYITEEVESEQEVDSRFGSDMKLSADDGNQITEDPLDDHATQSGVDNGNDHHTQYVGDLTTQIVDNIAVQTVDICTMQTVDGFAGQIFSKSHPIQSINDHTTETVDDVHTTAVMQDDCVAQIVDINHSQQVRIQEKPSNDGDYNECLSNIKNEIVQNRRQEITVYIKEKIEEQMGGCQNGILSTGETNENGETNEENGDPLMKASVLIESLKSGLKCIECKKAFCSRDDLKLHMSIHVDKQCHICDVCGQTFSQKNILRKHMTDHHGEKQKYKCSVCWGDFLFDTDLAIHMKTHLSKKKIECSVCGLKFKRKSGLVRHLTVHSGDRPFACNVCSMTFVSDNNLARHRRNHTRIIEAIPENGLSCEVKERNPSVLEQLESSVVYGNTSDAFTVNEDTSDAFTVNENTSDAFTVTESTSDAFKVNENEMDGCSGREETNVIDKELSCTICGRKFKKKCNLANHSKAHSSIRPFACSMCSFTFKSKASLRIHWRRHKYTDRGHISKNRLENMVTYNTTETSSLLDGQGSNLMDRNNGDDLTSVNDSDMIEFTPVNDSDMTDFIPVNGRKTNSTLVSDSEMTDFPHVNDSEDTSSGNKVQPKLVKKSLTCTFCDMKCKTPCGLAIHLKMHTGYRPYCCSMCSMRFIHKRTLLRHQKERHKDIVQSFSKCKKGDVVPGDTREEADSFVNNRSEIVNFTKVNGYEKSIDDEGIAEKTSFSNKTKISNKKMYTCTICDTTFFKYVKLLRHKKSHRLKAFNCSLCSQAFTSKGNRDRHFKRHSNVWDCYICGKKNLRGANYHNHVKKHKATGDGISKEVGEALNSKGTKEGTEVGESERSIKGRKYTIQERKSAIEKDVYNNGEDLNSNENLFHCFLCGMVFVSYLSLTKHEEIHFERLGLTCNVCEMNFATSTDFESHKVVSGHNVSQSVQQIEYRCKVCGKSILHRGSFTMHWRSHVAKGEIQEQLYDPNESEINPHSNVPGVQFGDLMHNKILSNKEAKWTCNKCGNKAFHNYKAFRRHCNRHKRSGAYRCRICDKFFKKKLGLERHVPVHSKNTFCRGGKAFLNGHDLISEKSMFENPVGESVSMFNGLEGSVEMSISEGVEISAELTQPLGENETEPLSIKYTKDVGVTDNKTKDIAKDIPIDSEAKEDTRIRQMHDVSNATNGDEGNCDPGESSLNNTATSQDTDDANKDVYNCPVCDKSFTRYHKLVSHQKVHFETLIYDCNKCPRSFLFKDEYDSHRKTHYKSNDGITFECPICERRIRNVGNYNKHVMSHDNGKEKKTETVDNQGPPFTCDMCGQVFQRKSNCKDHMKRHSEKDVKCIPCGKRFLRKKEYDIHMQQNHKDQTDSVPSDGSIHSNKSLVQEMTVYVDENICDVVEDMDHFPEEENISVGWQDPLKEDREHFLEGEMYRRDLLEEEGRNTHENSEYKRSFDRNVTTSCNDSDVVDGAPRIEMFSSDFRLKESSEDSRKGDGKVVESSVVKDFKVQPLGKKGLVCSICNKRFFHYHEYRKHRKAHAGSFKSRCNVCKKSFARHSHYVRHMKVHYPVWNVCQACGKKYRNEYSYKNHRCKGRKETANGTNSLEESVSANETIYLEEGLQAKSEAHGKKENNAELNVNAGVIVKGQTSKKAPHSSLSSSGGVETSHLGSNRFVNEKADDPLEGNISKKHLTLPSYSGEQACPICNKKFKYRNLKKHMEVHSNYKPYKCHICQKNMSGEQRFKRHMKNHLPEKQFGCKVCMKTFNHKYLVRRHHRQSHKNIEFDIGSEILIQITPAIEKGCNVKNVGEEMHTPSGKGQTKASVHATGKREEESSSSVKDLPINIIEKKKAMKDYVKIYPQNLTDKGSSKTLIPCPLCGKPSSSPSQLYDHIISHSNDKPFKCPLCKICFKRLSDQKKHIRNIHSCDPDRLQPKGSMSKKSGGAIDLPYKCSICDKSFLYDTVFKAHMMFHTGESTMDYIATEEELYECAVETNEDIVVHGSEPAVEEISRSMKEEIEFFVEDVAIDIKEEIIEDMEDTNTDDFQMLIDVDLDNFPVAGIGNAAAESLSRTELCSGRLEKIENDNKSQVNIAEDKMRCVRKDLQTNSIGERASEGDNSCKLTEEVSKVKKHLYCKICDRTFDASKSLYIHISKHQDRVLYKCDTCGETSKSCGNYRLHAQQHISTTYSKHSQNEHEQKEMGEETDNLREAATTNRVNIKCKWSCQICGKAYPNKRRLNSHMATHSKSMVCVCQACGEHFQSKGHALEHAEQHLTLLYDGMHAEAPTLFNNDALTEAVPQVNFVGEGSTNNHDNVEQPFKCSLCWETFGLLETLEEHKRKHLMEVDVSPLDFQVDLLQKRVKYPLPTGKGKASERTSNVPKPFACTYCDKRFQHLNSMKNHTRLHTGEKLHECTVCEKKFMKKSHLESHKLIHF